MNVEMNDDDPDNKPLRSLWAEPATRCEVVLLLLFYVLVDSTLGAFARGFARAWLGD